MYGIYLLFKLPSLSFSMFPIIIMRTLGYCLFVGLHLVASNRWIELKIPGGEM